MYHIVYMHLAQGSSLDGTLSSCFHTTIVIQNTQYQYRTLLR